MNTNVTLKDGLEFDTLDDAWKFWENYGGIKGFRVRKQYPNKNKKDGSITGYLYVCSKEGVRKPPATGLDFFSTFLVGLATASPPKTCLKINFLMSVSFALR
jgi:hypothetical protein